jgi:hypothetical protein
MGIYSEYLERNFDFDGLTAERKIQLARISELRGRDVLVYAADLDKAGVPTSIDYSDLLAFQDQLSELAGKEIDVILETPGGSGEVAEDLVRMLHDKYEEVGFIIPGWAKSAGTIMAMAGDDILMEPGSALGPIDAQLQFQGKQFSAEALREGMEKIKKEVADTGALNKAYIPILQGISPGELQNAENALNFAKELVKGWLTEFKFKNWNSHASSGNPVTEDEKLDRAKEIADVLCSHSRWLTHGRSIKITDLEAMRLKITDFSKVPDLSDAIRRYHTLLRMTFATNIYKVIETPTSQIMRFIPMQGVVDSSQAARAHVDIICPKCGKTHKLQANLDSVQPLEDGAASWPKDNRLKCESCGTEVDVSDARRQIEATTNKRVIAE